MVYDPMKEHPCPFPDCTKVIPYGTGGTCGDPEHQEWLAREMAGMNAGVPTDNYSTDPDTDAHPHRP